ncbi:hypothetical protein [Pseudomonas serbica]|jgi:hypothetical protein|uniref:hypothetical protein n=1 Tax=Pseudomonas serbica TaxID=2965074 RepID=UPI00237A881A|nr:hypothetical protein [Pseudomonas serbica]
MHKPYDYFQEFFRVNEAGRPIPKFSVPVCNGRTQEILNPRHSVHIFPHLTEIDRRINALLESQAAGKEASDPEACFDDLAQLHRHAEKLFKQALFLDTADRNSWSHIEQAYTTAPEPSTLSSRLNDLKAFWKGRLESLVESEVAYSR